MYLNVLEDKNEQYSLEEYTEMFNAYYNSVMNAVETTKTAHEEALVAVKQANQKVIDTEAAYNSAVENASSVILDATDKLEEAKNAVVEAESKLDEAKQVQSNASLAVTSSSENVNKTSTAKQAKATDVSVAEKAVANTENVLLTAENALSSVTEERTTKSNALASAKSSQIQKNVALDHAKDASNTKKEKLDAKKADVLALVSTSVEQDDYDSVLGAVNSEISVAQQKVSDLQAEYNALNTEAEEAAIQSVKSEYEAKISAVDAASTALVQKTTAYQAAVQDVEAARATLQAAQDKMDELNTSYDAAIAALNKAKQNEADALTTYDSAKAAEKTATETLVNATAVLNAARQAATLAQNEYDSAYDLYMAAVALYNADVAQLADFRAIKQSIIDAQNLSSVKDEALAAAKATWVEAKEAVSVAQDAYPKAQTATKDATDVLAAAKQVAADTKAVYNLAETTVGTQKENYDAAVNDLSGAKKALKDAEAAVPIETDFDSLNKAVEDAKKAVTDIQKLLTQTKQDYAEALDILDEAQSVYLSAKATYDEVYALTLKIDDGVVNEIGKETADKIQETGKKITVKVTKDSIDYSKLGEGYNAENTVMDVSLDMRLIEASLKKTGSRTMTYDISPVVTLSVNGSVVKQDELNNYLKNGAKITVTLPMNGLDVKEIVHKDGKMTEYIYDFKKDVTTDTLTFTVSHFSTFTLNESIVNPAYSDGRKPVENTATEAGQKGIDYTGMVAGFIATVSLVSYSVLRRKCKFVD